MFWGAWGCYKIDGLQEKESDSLNTILWWTLEINIVIILHYYLKMIINLWKNDVANSILMKDWDLYEN